MKILSVKRFSGADLLSQIRSTRLRGYAGAQPYEHAAIELVRAMDTAKLCPAQNYVLTPGVEKILELRTALVLEGIDIFDLDGGLYVTTDEHPDEVIPVLPPIIEESEEPDGHQVLLINDGMHRVFAARACGLPISVVLVRGVPAEYPYYAYALPRGWEAVAAFTELPEVHQKKEYRQPAAYKALFRDFNALFPGIQKERRQTNPEHIQM